MSTNYKCVVAKGLYNTGIGLKYTMWGAGILAMTFMLGLGIYGIWKDPKSFGAALLILVVPFAIIIPVAFLIDWVHKWVRRNRIAGPCVEQSTYEYDI